MKTLPLPLTRDLVLIGGGHAHALLLRRWAMAPLAGVRVTVINPDPTAPYTGMLPGHIAGHYPREALEIDLVRLARFAGARLILGRATGIDRAARLISVPGRAAVGYDVASVDIGIGSAMPEVAGFAAHAVAAKPLGAYAAAWAAYLEGIGRDGAHPVVIGGGVAGVELALAMAARLRGMGADTAVTVIEAGAAPMPGLGRGARRALLAHLARLGVRVICGVRVQALEPGAVHLSDGRVLRADFTVGAAGARPQGWLADTGLDLADGFIRVGPTLRSVTDPLIFAVGDCAHLQHAPRPKAGVFAVRQAPVLHDNLRAALSGGRMRPYHPQRDFLKLISTGGKGAVADKFGMRLDGRWLWWLKDRIDRAFMRKFTDLPAMPVPALPAQVALGVPEALAGGRPLCGGCGSKVGRAGLVAALPGLATWPGDGLPTGPGDDAAVLITGGVRQVISTDHLRAFSDDWGLMARIAAIHALGDIWAMGATPQAALASIILPRMDAGLQARTLTEIMAEAGAVLAQAGATVVGGHTSLGAELTIGFTLTGLADGPVLAKAGARPGDALILTKPLGTGVILAAEMQGAAPGEVVAGAYGAMTRTAQSASAVLRGAAHAMTDVTGFGLAGHLIEMMEASGTAATIDLADIPALPGALALLGAGHRAFVAADNRTALDRMHLPDGWPDIGPNTAPSDPRLDLLFDPQTAGGLLAAVPAAQADDILARLRAMGDAAARIGTVGDGPARLVITAGAPMPPCPHPPGPLGRVKT